jgi:hypothetical protein
MDTRSCARWRTGGTLLVVVCVAALLIAPAAAVKRAVESVNCGGTDSQSASYRAHDTIAQCPIGPVAAGGGIRAYDGFWLCLPNINVPVEGAVIAALAEDGSPVIRWTVGSLDGVDGFNVYRALEEEGPYELLNEPLLEADTPGSYIDATTWPQTTFWYEVRVVFPDGVEEAVAGSPVMIETKGTLALALYPFRPNPTSGETTVLFDIPDHTGTVHLDIYNVRGQHVSAMVDGPVDRGRHEVAWNGRDRGGKRVAAGVYFARLLVDGRSSDQKVMVLR